MSARYDMRESTTPGTWEVYDTTTGEAVRVDVPQTGLDIQDADELRDALNYLDRRKPFAH